ncbi:TetR family transcriptional regulator [Actinoplanes sp. OR16]|uniref:TetR/AcrR family transcriptional regulator n=1 Tax=Actinoplanes sp. OR16 TaxID=946334 RepID=UPI000F6E14DE|nr:TetR family transcriptional regulator C-terminal domain-containing protein [Actinoplanes sp. OR16]BBH67388.1 TetR family transcriptional regulator [Actinoplanes sp. OR16]
MPKIVDHDQRRSEIVEAYLTVVARDGLPAATSRAVAAELGVGTGALWHYFDGFDAVAAGAYQRISELATERIVAGTAHLRGLDAFDVMLREILPLEKRTVDEAYVVVGFWGRLAANKRIAETQTDVVEEWREMLRRHLEEAIADGTMLPETPVDEVINVVLTIAVAQQVHAVTDSELAEPSRQLKMVEFCLLPWRSAA